MAAASSHSSQASQLSALPVVVHGQGAVTRISQADLLQYEAMLRTADDSMEACMKSRARRHGPADEETAAAILRSVCDTISALTDAPCPTQFGSKLEAVKWTSRALLTWRDTTLQTASKHNVPPGMDPDTMALCVDAVSKLTAAMGGDPQAVHYA